VAQAAQADETVPVNPITAVQQIKPPQVGDVPVIDPFALYDGEIVFDVYRKRNRVGEHRVTFGRDADRLTVSAHFTLAVKVLFVKAYTFDYRATETWQGTSLIGMSATNDDNGKLTVVSAKPEGDLFRIDGPRGSILASSWMFPTNHWNRGQANASVILNTLTGQLANVTIERRGIDRVETATGTFDAEHFVYTGDLRDTDVWYDSEGRWVKMAFKARDGSRIEYRCRRCGPADPAATAAIVPPSGGAATQTMSAGPGG
jgi:hypothetical protein